MTALPTNLPPPSSTEAANLSPSIGLRVIKGALVPASETDRDQLRRLNLGLNQTVYAELDWRRCSSDLARIHRLGQLLVEQVDRFAHMSAHQAIKTLQAESGAGCNVISLKAGVLADITGLPCAGNPDALVAINQPWTLSPRHCSGAQFADLLDQLCRYIALHIWPDCSAEQVKAWAHLMPASCP